MLVRPPRGLPLEATKTQRMPNAGEEVVLQAGGWGRGWKSPGGGIRGRRDAPWHPPATPAPGRLAGSGKPAVDPETPASGRRSAPTRPSRPPAGKGNPVCASSSAPRTGQRPFQLHAASTLPSSPMSGSAARPGSSRPENCFPLRRSWKATSRGADSDANT